LTPSSTLARLSAPALALLVSPWLATPAAAQDAPESAPASRPESAPSSPESKRALGAEFLRMGRRAEAIQAFREAYELDGALESGLEWSRALLADGRWNDTLRALDAIAEKHPKRLELFLAFAEAQAARAEARRREGAGDVAVAAEYEAAARSIQDALEVKPGEFDLYFRLTQYFISAGKADEAIDVNGEARKKNTKAWQIPVCEGDARVAQLEAEGLLADKPNADDASKADRKDKLDAARAAYEEAARLGADRA
jgi:tetratricopeptide (TPR) repeat protein